MADELSEVIERILGRVSRIVMVGTAGAVVVIVGASAFITRLDLRLAVVEEKQIETVEQLKILNERIAPSMFMEREMQEIKVEQQRLQLGIDVVECRIGGGSAAECRAAVESYTGR